MAKHQQEVDPMGDMRELAAKYEEVLKSGDFGRVRELAKDYSTDDFVERMEPVKA
jgi:hypothetical protein